ncbi:MAG: type I phosphomannose isomerase catalytic subunit [Gemmataceae bacterium]
MNPLCFRPHFVPKVWGGQKLHTVLGKTLPDDSPIGESWDLSDHASHHSVVRDGAFAGKTLQDLMTAHRQELLGARAESYDVFPWLIKFLDCNDWLSVQVHPDEVAVKTLWPGEGSKTEAWFVVDAEPESRIYAGLLEGVDEAKLRQALQDGNVASCLYEFTPQPGDCVFLKAGTVHAVGGGVLMAEIQQTSDATFRLFDWNRVDAEGNSRTLHIEESIKATHWDYGPVKPINVVDYRSRSDGPARVALVDSPYFSMEYIQTPSAVGVQNADHEKSTLRALMVVRGQGRLSTKASQDTIRTGEVWLLPASSQEAELVADGTLGVVHCALP